jgi:hypothetical protein
MEDLTASAISPASKWEKTPADEGRKHPRHRPRQEKPGDEGVEDLETTEPHNLDELA